MSHPGANERNLPSQNNNGVSNSGQQDPGLHPTIQDPGPPTQHHVSSRPFLYIHAPPPPPFFHYQWPMPFSYNPFVGLPGMGYGMVMPPFPPPHYMDAPTYILPHPHIQPVDYRRLLHPQVHAPNTPYQNPNQNRRVRLHVRETVNIEVQTEPTQPSVGTYGERSPLVSSDSGHGTASNSPSSSSCSEKQAPAEAENFTLSSSNLKNIQVNRNCTSGIVKHNFNILHHTGLKNIQSSIRATLETQHCEKSVGQENVSPCRDGRYNMGSVSSSNGIAPVCSSSQQKDEVVKERRVSVPDILMSWGGGTPQVTVLKMADKVLPQNDCQLVSFETKLEYEKLAYQDLPETNVDQVVSDGTDANYVEDILSSKDSEKQFEDLENDFMLSESRSNNEPVEVVGSVRHCLPYRDELLHSSSNSLPDDEQEDGNKTNPHNTTEIIPYQMSVNSCQMNRKMNESVWSVESLAPFIPSKEWLLRNGMFEPDVIVEITEEAERCGLSNQKDNPVVTAGKERRWSRQFSSSDSVLMSDSWLVFSTPAEKPSSPEKPATESEGDAFETRRLQQSQTMAPIGKDAIASPTNLKSEIIASTPSEDVNEDGSSEPAANQSPNQESFIVNEKQEKSLCSSDATLLLNSAAEEKTSPKGQPTVQNDVCMETEDGACGKNDLLCIPVTGEKMDQVSPAKRHLVDCGTQCNELQKCSCEELKGSMGSNRKHNFKYSDMQKVHIENAEVFMKNGHVQKNHKRHAHWKNRGSGGGGRKLQY